MQSGKKSPHNNEEGHSDYPATRHPSPLPARQLLFFQGKTNFNKKKSTRQTQP
jgi:hypothetical protein